MAGKSLAKITEISLEIGAMTGVVADSLIFSFGFASKGTIADEALLQIAMKPVRAACSPCGQEYEVRNQDFTCPECKARNFKIIGGRELLITGIEAE